MNVALLLLLASPWTTIADEGGVKVETRSAGPGHTVVRGTVELPFSAEQIERVLRDLPGFDEWIPSLHTWRVIESGPDRAYVYARHDLPWPLDDRDYRVQYRWRTTKDGAFHLEARSTTKKGPAPIDGVVRLVDVRSLWTVRPKGSERAHVTYKYHGELGGDLPESVVQSTWEKEPGVLFGALETELRRRQSEKKP